MALDSFALFLVLVSALMHAGWNLIAKLGEDRLMAIALIKAPTLALALLILAIVPAPAPASWPYLAASIGVNLLYYYFLINAYRTGDLSLAYPIARGVGPMLVLLLSWPIAGESPTMASIAGVSVICLALFALGLERGAGARHYQSIVWAAGVGVCIGVYTVGDGLGGRLSGSPLGYVAALSAVTGVVVCGFTAMRRGAAFTQALRLHWKNGTLGGAMMLAAYGIAVYAMTIAPMAYIAALRESSVIFAAILGAVFLREPFGAKRIVAAGGVAAGIAILVLGR